MGQVSVITEIKWGIPNDLVDPDELSNLKHKTQKVYKSVLLTVNKDRGFM